MYTQWKTSGVCAEEQTDPEGAFNGIRERSVQYLARNGKFSKRRAEYESAIQVESLRVSGTMFKARVSTGDKVIFGVVERQSCTIGQTEAISSAAE